MIIAYIVSAKGAAQKVEIQAGQPIPANAVWVDMLEPDDEEEKLVERTFKIDAPTRKEMDKIEVMSPFYKEEGSFYLTVTVLNKVDSEYPESSAITFILTKKCLITLRYSKPRAFNNFSARLMRHSHLWGSSEMILHGLVGSIVNNLADILEQTGNKIDKLLVDVFEKPTEIRKKPIRKLSKKLSATNYETEDNVGLHYINIIKRVGRTGYLISKMRESLVSLNRMLIFLKDFDEATYSIKKEQQLGVKGITKQIQPLTEYADFLSQRNSFLLDATLGMLNVEQNMVIKIFTIAATAFLPPTLIASIYGMNFHNMPELSLPYGYPLALIAMALSAAGPFYYFKKKGWL